MISVIDSGRWPFLRALGDAISDALSTEAAAGTSAAAIALPAAEPRRELEGADSVLALDPESLARASEARVPVCIAWVGWLEPGWEDAITGAHHVLVAHAALVDAVIAMGAPRARVEVSSWAAPRGLPSSRAAAREALGVDADAPLVIVPMPVVGDDLLALLLQLALVREGVRIAFDVGEDADAARALRSRVSFPAHMFAEGPTAALAWTAADRALARLEGPELARALAHGVAPVLAPPRPADLFAARALVDSGLATLVASDVTLAVAIDEACSAASIARSRAAIDALELASGAVRIAQAAERVLRAPGARRLAAGLPEGLEAIGPEPGSSPPPAPPAGPKEDPIEKELEALRARLRGESS